MIGLTHTAGVQPLCAVAQNTWKWSWTVFCKIVGRNRNMLHDSCIFCTMQLTCAYSITSCPLMSNYYCNCCDFSCFLSFFLATGVNKMAMDTSHNVVSDYVRATSFNKSLHLITLQWKQQTRSLIPPKCQQKFRHSETLLCVCSCSYLLAAVYQLGQLTSAVNRRRKPAAINNKPQHPPTPTCNTADR